MTATAAQQSFPFPTRNRREWQVAVRAAALGDLDAKTYVDDVRYAFKHYVETAPGTLGNKLTSNRLREFSLFDRAQRHLEHKQNRFRLASEAAARSADVWHSKPRSIGIVERLAAVREDIAFELSDAFVRCRYRRPSDKWVGGKFDFQVEIHSKLPPTVKVFSQRVWHKNRRWTGQNVRVTASVGLDYRKIPGELRVVDGLLVLRVRSIGPETWSAVVAEQGRGLDIVCRECVLLRSGGEIFKAKTLRAARIRAKAQDRERGQP